MQFVLGSHMGFSSSKNIFAPGSVHMFPGAVPPAGFLICDGSYVNRDDYPDLFDAIGTIYGTTSPGDFRLPQYGGYFLRCQSLASGIDPGAATRIDRGDGVVGDNVGTKQSDANIAHSHNVTFGSLGGNGLPLKGTFNGGYRGMSTVGSIENRPININLMFVIKV
jgi:hypothetical protein